MIFLVILMILDPDSLPHVLFIKQRDPSNCKLNHVEELKTIKLLVLILF